MNLHTETMMRYFPGMGICAMENGGMMFTEDGDYVDAIDVLLPTRDSMSIDVVDGDGDKGRMSIPYYDGENMFTEYPNEFRSEDTESPDEELDRLVAEQAHDDAGTIYIETNSEDEISEEITPSHSSEGHQPFEFQGHEAFLRHGTRHKCSQHDRGRMPERKDHRQHRPTIW